MKSNWFFVSAKAGDSIVLYCLSTALPDGDALPETVQLFPPGRHEIQPTSSSEGAPKSLTMDINAAVAEVIRKDFLAMQAAAAQNNGPKPYTDFNHEDGPASAWVLDVFWAGEDPKNGGIRAKVEWTNSGKAAVVGKEYRQFSPNFRVSRGTGEIVGTVANMGGLVNRPAFKGIESFFAKHGETDNNPNENNMNKLHQALVAAGLLSVVHTDEAAAVIEFNAKWGGIQTKLEQGKTDATLAKVQKETLETVTKDLDIVKAKADKFAKANAETIVAGWVKDGIIAPKDDEGKKTWTELLAKDPDNAKLMEPVIKAKAAAGGGGAANDPTKPVVESQNNNGQQQQQQVAAKGPVAEFQAKCKEIETRDKIKHNDAVVVAAQENPKLYGEYRKGLLFVDPAKAGQAA